MIQVARAYAMMVEHDRAVPMIEQIDQIMDALLDRDLIVSITIRTNSSMILHCPSYSFQFRTSLEGEFFGRWQ